MDDGKPMTNVVEEGTSLTTRAIARTSGWSSSISRRHGLWLIGGFPSLDMILTGARRTLLAVSGGGGGGVSGGSGGGIGGGILFIMVIIVITVWESLRVHDVEVGGQVMGEISKEKKKRFEGGGAITGRRRFSHQYIGSPSNDQGNGAVGILMVSSSLQ